MIINERLVFKYMYKGMWVTHATGPAFDKYLLRKWLDSFKERWGHVS